MIPATMVSPVLVASLRALVLFAACAGPTGASAAVDTSAQAQRNDALRQRAIAYEFGNGVPKSGERAAALYCEAARSGDADSQFALGWVYANGRGVPRDDATAAYFFRLAADQGVVQATNMLAILPPAQDAAPLCMRDPVDPARADDARRNEYAPPPHRVAPAMVEFVTHAANQGQVPLSLVWAIMAAESGFNPDAWSPKNAQGLMQLIPETASRFRVKNAFDPKQNVRGGVAYLRWLLAYFQGDVALVAAAYNAGEGAVERYAGVPPYLETRAYVKRIVEAVGAAPRPYDPSVVEPSARLPVIRSRQAAVPLGVE